MSKYTAEQVEKEAEYQSHKFLTYTTVGMLRDYATLLRGRESAKLPEGLRERIERAWHDHDEDGRVSISMADAKMLVEQVLAAAPKPETIWPKNAREKAFSLAREMLKKGSAKPEKE